MESGRSELGASLLRRNERWHTLADPAGHPFDLCVSDDPRTTLTSVMLDCPDAKALSRFYAELLGKPVTYEADGVAMIGEDGAQPVMFQQVEQYTMPRWPDPAYPQQIHLDVTVHDVYAAERAPSRSVPPGWTAPARTGASTPIRPASHFVWCGRSNQAGGRAQKAPSRAPTLGQTQRHRSESASMRARSPRWTGRVTRSSVSARSHTSLP